MQRKERNNNCSLGKSQQRIHQDAEFDNGSTPKKTKTRLKTSSALIIFTSLNNNTILLQLRKKKVTKQ